MKGILSLFFLIGTAAAQTTFTLEKTSYPIGEPITASWANSPENATNWVGIYPRGTVPDGNPASTVWLYVNGTTTATTPVVSGSVTFPSPSLSAGNWSAHFLADDGYSPISTAVDFTVIDPGADGGLHVVTPSIRRIYALSGQAYTGTIAAYARTGEVGGISYTKINGPDWLRIAPDGELSGLPDLANIGTNVFEVLISDGIENENATLTIQVFKPGTVDIPTLKVLSFNVWVGTSRVSEGSQKGLESVILSDADVVAICENNGRAAQWAADLGWHVVQSGSDNAVLSRYPLGNRFTASHSVGSTIQIASSPVREINFWSCHLTAYPYGPYDARDASGGDAAKVSAALAAETNSGRVAQVNDILLKANSQLANADTVPVMLLGDFNCPSHLDWTPGTANAGKHFGLVVDWPVTRATESAGMIDAFRAAYPDPVAVSGDTWTPIDPGDVQDRIDMVHYKGSPLSVIDCRVFTTIDVGRWPSDHAGVLAEFALVPADVDEDGLADSWENLHFGDTISQDAGGNPDGDSLSNFAERAFALDPNVTEDQAVARISNNGNTPSLHYRRLTGGKQENGRYLAKGLSYQIETSVDLLGWTPAGENLLTGDTPTPLNSGAEEATFRLTEPINAPRYYRIRVR